MCRVPARSQGRRRVSSAHKAYANGMAVLGQCYLVLVCWATPAAHFRLSQGAAAPSEVWAPCALSSRSESTHDSDVAWKRLAQLGGWAALGTAPGAAPFRRLLHGGRRRSVDRCEWPATTELARTALRLDRRTGRSARPERHSPAVKLTVQRRLRVVRAGSSRSKDLSSALRRAMPRPPVPGPAPAPPDRRGRSG